MNSSTTTVAEQPEVGSFAADVLVGADAIAQETGLPIAMIYHAAKTGKLPIRKWGRYLIASRRALRKAADKITA